MTGEQGRGQLTGGLLAVHAHPDDETLSTGALLATWAAAGEPVTVVTCTRGERGEVMPADLAHLEGDGPSLAAHRESELRAACVALGVTQQLFLDTLVAHAPGAPPRWADSGMAWVASGRAGAASDVPDDAFVRVPVEQAARALAGLLSRRRPEVVVGYEPGGGYGHPDHVHAHDVLHHALDLLAADGGPMPDQVLWAAVDGSALRHARGVLRNLGLDVPADDAEIPSAVVEPAAVDLRVPVVPVRDALLAALHAHATQVRVLRTDLDPADGVLGAFTLSNDVVQPLLAHEAYRRVR